MDIPRAADALYKSYASLSLLANTSSVARHAALKRTTFIRTPARAPWTCQSCRRLSSSPALRRPQGESSVPDYNDDMYKRRDSGFFPARKPNSANTRATGQQPRTKTATKAPPEGTSTSRTSVDDLLDAHQEPQANSLSWARPLERRAITTAPTGSRFTSSALDFPDPLSIAGISTGRSSSATLLPRPRVLTELDIHVKPRTGRTIAVDPQSSTDLGAKLRALDSLLIRNKVKSDHYKQKFHERPGLKRKRLKMVRWRDNFKNRFTTVVNRVNNLKAQGW